MMICKPRISVGILFAVCLLNSVQAQSNLRRPKAILLQMVDEYKRASTYQDVGILRLIPQGSLDPSSAQSLFPTNHRARKHIAFKLFYSTPQLFRFEWQRFSDKTAQRPSVIWFDGREGYSWSANPAFGDGRFSFEKKGKIESLIQDSLKPSGGMVSTVPTLLINNSSPYRFAELISDLTDISLVKQEVVDGERCFVVSGKVRGTPWAFWVGTKTHLLRKIRSLYSIGSFDDPRQTRRFVAEEIHTNIRIDENIPLVVYQYQPRLRPGDLDLTR